MIDGVFGGLFGCAGVPASGQAAAAAADHRHWAVVNGGAEPFTVYGRLGERLAILMPGEQFPPPPGIYWTRTGGKTWNVVIRR